MSARREISRSTVRRRLGLFFVLSICLIMTSPSNIAAQPPLGAASEVWVNVPDTVCVGQEVGLEVYMANEAGFEAFATTFRIYSENNARWDWIVQPDSEWDFNGEINIVSPVIDFRLWEYLPYRLGEWGPTDSLSARFLISGVTFSEPFGPAGPLDHAYTVFLRPTMTGTICIDSSEFPPSSDQWIFNPPGDPAWNGPFCFTVVEAPKGDINCDGAGNLADAVYIVNWIFKGGPEPCR